MKEKELRAAAVCAVCHKRFGHTGMPMFYRVTIERHGLIVNEVRRQDGLAQYLGSSEIAWVMGEDAEMTMPLMKPATVTLCERCANSVDTVFALLLESVHAQSESDAEEATHE